MTVSEEKQATNITVIYHREIIDKKSVAIPRDLNGGIAEPVGDPVRQAAAFSG